MAVFHLKYRPSTLEELDLTEVSQVLSKILTASEMPQAFLFAGPKGSGKTSSARIFARAINCVSPKGVEPCNECESCKDVMGGSSLDIIEIDAASNRGIEDVRALKDKAYLLPARLKRKVFIIDEVHMLTKEAFNALLKLIEEPPKHTVFILCTTDPQKIPETVVSRLVRVDFRKGSRKDMERSLKKIIKGEGIEIDEESINLIIDKSDGSFRNLQRTFNEIFLDLGKTISQEKVKEFFDVRGGDYRESEFEKDLATGDTKKILEKIEKMADKGIDFSVFRESLIVYFQKRLLSFYGVEGIKNEGGLGAADTARLLNALIAAGKLEKDAGIDQLPLELVVVEFNEKGNRRGGNTEAGKEGEAAAAKNETVKTAKQENTQEGKDSAPVPDVRVAAVVKDAVKTKRVGGVSLAKEEVESKWSVVLQSVKAVNHSIEAFLRSASPGKVEEGTFVLEVFYPFHKDKLEEAKNRRVVEKGLKEAYGADLDLECVLSKDKRKPLVINNYTPMQEVNQDLVKSESIPDTANGSNGTGDMYDVAKEIFG